MNNIEDILSEKGKDLKKIKAPDEMETRLRNALKTNKTRKRNNNFKKIVSIAAVLFLVFSILNFDTLAYIGKRFFGYDEILSNDIEKLNELGEGQTIGKSQKITDDIMVYLDGVMLDDTQLLVFYRVEKKDGKIDEIHANIPSIYSIIDRCYHQHSTGKMNEDKTGISYVASYETPGLFSKKFNFEGVVEYENKNYEFDIEFKLDRNKAVGKTAKVKINKKIDIGSTNVVIKKLIVSPTQTIIEGNLETKFDKNSMYRERAHPDIDIKLIADGNKVINYSGKNISSSIKGTKFSCEYESLAENIESLEMIIEKVKVYNKTNEEILVCDNYNTTIDGQYFEILDVSAKNNETWITVKSEEGTQFLDVSLFAENTELQFDSTIDGDYEKVVEGEEAKIYYTRTFVFKGNGDNLRMNIGSMYYNINIDKRFELLTK